MMLHLPEWMDHPQRTIDEYKALLDYEYGAKQTEHQLMPSDWVDLLLRVDYLPGWTIEVSVHRLLSSPGIQLDLKVSGGQFGMRHIVSPYAAPDERIAGYIIENMVHEVQRTIHKANFTIRPA